MELKIIFFLIIIHYIGFMLNNKKTSVLSCGIFGWAGKNYKQFDKAKFDIQGLFNNARGGDSCGVTTDGEIYYGINNSKHYASFLVNSNYTPPTSIPVVIGHTRKSSSGAVNGENAHPFGFGGNKDRFEFIGVHNGTLYNKEELAKDFGIETSVYKKNVHTETFVFDRMKIDSEVLLESIYKSKNFKVLSGYTGGAALLFTNTNEPNVVYAFRGASRLEKNGSHTLVDERPLFYYIENKNSVYFSSMEESLVAIGGEANENLFLLDENTVYKITDGDIKSAEKILVSRANACQRAFTNYGASDYMGRNTSACDLGYAKRTVTLPARQHKIFDDDDDIYSKKGDQEDQDIREEKIVRYFKSPVYMNKLRYYRNGHLISGVYTWIEGYGFKFLCTDADDAFVESQKIINQPFCLEKGIFIPNDSSAHALESTRYPFNTANKLQPALLYFNDGILFETELDYKAVSSKTVAFTIQELSEASKHPIISLHTSLATKHDQNIYYKAEKFTGNISPLGSNKIYTIEKGNLVKTVVLEKEVIEEISNTENKDVKLLQLNSGAEIVAQQENQELLKEKFRNFMDGERYSGSEDDLLDSPLIKGEEIDEDALEESIDEIMIPLYTSVQEANDELNELSDNNVVKQIMKVNADYLLSLDEIVLNSYRS